MGLIIISQNVLCRNRFAAVGAAGRWLDVFLRGWWLRWAEWLSAECRADWQIDPRSFCLWPYRWRHYGWLGRLLWVMVSTNSLISSIQWQNSHSPWFFASISCRRVFPYSCCRIQGLWGGWAFVWAWWRLWWRMGSGECCEYTNIFPFSPLFKVSINFLISFQLPLFRLYYLETTDIFPTFLPSNTLLI